MNHVFLVEPVHGVNIGISGCFALCMCPAVNNVTSAVSITACARGMNVVAIIDGPGVLGPISLGILGPFVGRAPANPVPTLWRSECCFHEFAVFDGLQAPPADLLNASVVRLL
ncbi:hypothetical protein BGX38DRAFT_1227167 [Terfezia claveryi]|nr:hypothetical protein BGX38DRAFT_1227167 [Terfezia claveryi]